MRFLDMLAMSLWSTLALIFLFAGAAIGAAVWLFGLGAVGAVSLYFVVWWLVLFVCLPIGIRSQREAGAVVPGTEAAAPADAAMRERAIMTTLCADVVFLAAVAALPLTGL